MAKAKRQQKEDKAPTHGASAVGWTFYSTALNCWHRWFLRYVEGLVPLQMPEELAIGIGYHALHEGKSAEELEKLGPDVLDGLATAARIHRARVTLGPPMPEATGKEVPAEVTGNHPLAGLYTCRLDRVEGNQVREFKSAGSFTGAEEDRWNTDGEIIGQLVASELSVIVDITTKEAAPRFKQVKVTLTPEKERAWRHLVLDLVHQIGDRVTRFERKGLREEEDGISREEKALQCFPRNLRSCIYGRRRCEYFARCWGTGGEQHLYKRQPAEEWRKRLLATK